MFATTNGLITFHLGCTYQLMYLCISAIICPTPPLVPSSTNDWTGKDVYVYGTTISYNCQSGMRFINGKTSWNIECGGDAQWSSVPSDCRGYYFCYIFIKMACTESSTKLD